MSEDQNTQTVVDATDAAAKPAVEVNGARNDGDDLDAALKEFDTVATPTATTAKPEPKPGTADSDLKTTLDQVKGYVTEAQRLQFRTDMDKTIKAVRGDLPDDVFDDGLVEAWLDAEARKDPRLAKAWVDRHANPKQFERVQTELGKTFAKKFSKLPDRQATEDRAAVTAAVRGASTRAPEGKAPDFSKQTDAEFEASKEKLFGG